VPVLSELAMRTWSDAFGHTVRPADAAAALEDEHSETHFRQALCDTTILVAEAQDALVGYVQFGEVAIPEVDVHTGDQSIYRLYVETAHQGRGLGRRLTEAALAHPRLATRPASCSRSGPRTSA
jgi:diamine N-acetyltransferase